MIFQISSIRYIIGHDLLYFYPDSLFRLPCIFTQTPFLQGITPYIFTQTPFWLGQNISLFIWTWSFSTQVYFDFSFCPNHPQKAIPPKGHSRTSPTTCNIHITPIFLPRLPFYLVKKQKPKWLDPLMILGKYEKSRRRRADPQQIVTTRLLYCLQDPFAQLSRLQRI